MAVFAEAVVVLPSWSLSRVTWCPTGKPTPAIDTRRQRRATAGGHENLQKGSRRGRESARAPRLPPCRANGEEDMRRQITRAWARN